MSNPADDELSNSSKDLKAPADDELRKEINEMHWHHLAKNLGRAHANDDNCVDEILAWHQRKLEAEVAKAREAVDAAIIETLEWVIDEPIGAFTRQRIEDKLAQLRGDDEAAS